MDRSPVSRRRRDLITSAGAITALGTLGFPAIVRSQADAIRIGHLTPRTGFLGPLGEYAVMGVNLAVDEINAAGGIMGRKIELIAEDSVNETAATKAERLIERDKVVVLIGEISSASGPPSRRLPSATGRLSSTPAPTPTSCAARRATATRSIWRAATPCMSTPAGRRRWVTTWSKARSGTFLPPTTRSATTCSKWLRDSWPTMAANRRR